MNTAAQTASLESDSKLMTVTKIKQMPFELSPPALLAVTPVLSSHSLGVAHNQHFTWQSNKLPFYCSWQAFDQSQVCGPNLKCLLITCARTSLKKYFLHFKAIVKPKKGQPILCNTLTVTCMGLMILKDLMVTAKCTLQIAFWKEHNPEFISK